MSKSRETHHSASRLILLVIAVASLNWIFGANRASAGGRLAQMRSEVRTPKPDDDDDDDDSCCRSGEDNHGRRRHNRADSFDDRGDEGSETLSSLLGKGILFGLTTPFWLPPACVGDDYSSSASFLKYPYQHGDDGFLSFDRDGNSQSGREWSGRISGEYATDFGDLSRIRGRLLLESQNRFGFDTEAIYFRENLGGGLHDELWTGDANLVFRFAQSEQLQMRAGLGFNWLADSYDSDFGFNFTYGGDWMPAKPWVVSGNIDLGSISNATLVHGRITAGIQLNRVEFYTGYDHFRIGDARVDSLIGGISVTF